MYNSTGRSGIGEAFTGETYKGHTWQDIGGVSPNGRQYMSEVTGQPNNLSGSAYWEMRKDLPDMLDSATVITAESYKTPSYYHQPKKAKPVEIDSSAHASDTFGEVEQAAVENTPVDVHINVPKTLVDTPKSTQREKNAERTIGFLVLVITATVVFNVLF